MHEAGSAANRLRESKASVARLPENPDPPPAYTLQTFDLGGNHLGKVHLVRADRYSGQRCGPTGDPYVYRAASGSFECVRINPA